MKLVVVESPSKAKTIEKYLGKSFKVISTKGHIMDLPKSKLGVDIDNDFDANYIKMKDKLKVIKELVEKAKEADIVYLASDNDREGEAIASHVQQILESACKNIKEFKRIVFNEITKPVILKSIDTPLDINYHKVDSQKSRRVLDRLVGYKISPILWKKVARGLSAGRVQTVALRMIVEREKEREKFISEKYWKLKGIFQAKDVPLIETFAAKYENKKLDNKNKEIFEKLEKICEKEKTGKIESIKIKQSGIKNKPPFITATLQQEAFTRFGFSARKTMSIAQMLYEGIDLGDNRAGLITYMRTDSTRISSLAMARAKEFIQKEYGASYFVHNPALFLVSSPNAQDAHEAIRPTDIFFTPQSIAKNLTKDQLKIYSIIWERFCASLMRGPVISIMDIGINLKDILFTGQIKRLDEEGFLKVYNQLKINMKFEKFPDIKEEQPVDLVKYQLEEKQTEPPVRYDEASLIRKLKDSGIGRPSTYAPIVSVLFDRNYIFSENKKIIPTKLGITVCDLLVDFFPEQFDYTFTANMETQLDLIESAQMEYKDLIKNFWKDFSPLLDKFEDSESMKDKLKEVSSVFCEKCNSPMEVKWSKYGSFLGCSNFPECKNTKSFIYGVCPGCDNGLIVRRKGKKISFFGCSDYPQCSWLTNKKLSLLKCPDCGSYIVQVNDGEFQCINSECGRKFQRDEIQSLQKLGNNGASDDNEKQSIKTDREYPVKLSKKTTETKIGTEKKKSVPKKKKSGVKASAPKKSGKSKK